MPEDEADFPRGGAPTLTPLEVRKIRADAEKDVLFTKNVGPTPKKKKKKSSTTTDLDAISDVVKPKKKTVENFSFKYLIKEMLLLGYIKEISAKEIIVGLPNGLNGYIKTSDVRLKLEKLAFDDESDNDEEEDEGEGKYASFEETFKTGQVVPLIVKDLFPNLTGYKKIEMSLLPSDVNKNVNKNNIKAGMVVWGIVSCVEDHGYTISVGDNLNCFLPKKQVENSKSLKIGSTKWYVITKYNSKISTVTDDLEKVKKALVSKEDIKFSNILPGQLFKCNLTEEADECIFGKISSFEIVADKMHLAEKDPDMETIVGSKNVLGRIIHVNPKTKQVGVSFLPELTSFQGNVVDGSFKVGDVVQDCEVQEKSKTHGLVMKMPNGKYGAVHITRLADDEEKIGKKHAAGTKHSCRVIGYSGMDSNYTLSMKKSDMEKKFFSYNDITSGMVVKCTVISLETYGAILKISNHIRGLCPTLHLADIPLKKPSKKFVVDKKVTCRVLKVQPEKKKITLTHKKTMVGSELPIVDSYATAKVGSSVVGFVINVQSYGVVLGFYNDVRALMLKSEIIFPEGSRLEDVFYVGKVVQCVIISVNAEQKKMNVSMKKSGLKKADLAFGDKVEHVSFLSAMPSEIKLKVDDKSEVVLPKDHLSDFQSVSNDLMELIKSTENASLLNGAVVYGQDKKEKKTLVSCKKMLQSGEERLSFEDLKVDSVHGGTVVHIMDFGVFVDIAPGLRGLAPASHLTDRFTKDATQYFSVGQSVIAKVKDIDNEKRRFVITLKPSEVYAASQDNELYSQYSNIALLENVLSERNSIFEQISKSNDEELKLLLSLDKEVIIAKVDSITKEGVTLQYTVNDVTVNGFIPKAAKHGADFEQGETCQCFVPFIEIAQRRFIGYCQPEAIKDHIKKSKKKSKLTKEMNIESVVCYANEDLCVVLLPEHRHQIAYMPARMHLNEVNVTVMEINHKIKAQYERTSDYGILVSNLDQAESTEDPTNIKVGSIVNAVIKGIKPNQLSVTMCNGHLRGRVHISNVFDDFNEGDQILKDYTPSQIIKTKVVAFKDVKTHNYLAVTSTHKTIHYAELTLKKSDMEKSSDEFTDGKQSQLTDFEKGKEVNCFVTGLNKYDIQVCVDPFIRGKIPILMSSKDSKDYDKLKSKYPNGTALKASITDVDEKHKLLVLSRIGQPSDLLKKHSNVVGRITKSLKNGLLIELPNQKAGLAHVTELSDTFVDNPLDQHKLNTYVECQIIHVDTKNNHIDLSLRQSRILGQESVTEGIDKVVNGYDDLKEGDIIRGYVKACTKVGVFVSLSSNISGRVQIKNLSQFFVKDYQSLFPVGKLVKAKILSINPTNNNIDLSLRGKDVNDRDPAPPPPKRKSTDDTDEGTKVTGDGEENEEEGASQAKKRKIMDTSLDDGDADLNEQDESDQDEEMSEAEEDEESSEDEEDTEKETKPSLDISGGFDWSADVKMNTQSDSEESEDNEEDDKKSAKQTKRQKRAAKKAEEESLHKAELALLDTERQLESAEDFDRLVLGSPNSSIVWIQYMAFHLHAAEVDKAIAVGRKALKTISFREEQEKLNIWVALLNLENSYGTKASLETLFQEAVKANEPKKVYVKMVELYVKNDKNEEAEKLYQVMLKRFKQSKKVWVGYAYFLMKIGKHEEARALLQRSLKSLQQRKHVATILKFAIMEFKLGEAQRGGTIFESLLKNYPKKTDIWSIYIDMWIREQDFEQVRNIFERVITLSLSTKKMKFLFKRYVAFEEQHGDKTSVEKVRQKAAEYIDRHLFDDAEE
ncbi:protein RRP5 homolog [Clytia hemisphaerica]|uniref:S1 motif domain-containing protein n=1 Tax=Clytia hemisphaerica TaxID=252671 RepID=A0A7M5X6D5_9CNID